MVVPLPDGRHRHRPRPARPQQETGNQDLHSRQYLGTCRQQYHPPYLRIMAT